MLYPFSNLRMGVEDFIFVDVTFQFNRDWYQMQVIIKIVIEKFYSNLK